MSRIISSLVAIVLLLGAPLLSIAQEQADEVEIISTLTTGGANLNSPLNCFDFYRFNSVEIALESAVESTVPGTLMTFFGTIENTNSYPLTNTTLAVKVFRVNEELVQQANGNELIDYFLVEENMVLSANEKKELTIDWEVPANAAGGDYFMTVYVLDNDFAISGLAFSDDVYSNAIYFGVTGDDGDSVYLSKKSTTLNNEVYRYVDFPPAIDTSTTSVVISTELVNPSDIARSVPLQWRQYAFDASKEGNLRNVKTQLVTLEPGERKVVSYEVTPERAPVVFVVAMTEDKDVRSLLHIRYVQDEKTDITRLSFAGISSFPLTEGSEVTALACAHSTGDILPDNTLTLTLTDNNTGEVIHTYTYQGEISGQVGGYGEVFTSALGHDNVTLRAVLERQGVIMESTEVVYNCKKIEGVDCSEKTMGTTLFARLLANPVWFFAGSIVLLLLLLLVLSVHKRHNGSKTNINANLPPLSTLFFMLLLPAFLLFVPSGLVEAKTVSVNGSHSGSGRGGGLDVDFKADYTVLYHGDLINESTGTFINDGATIQAGTIVRLQPKVRSNSGVRTSDIHYTFNGSVQGTPNGAWNSYYYPGDMIGGGMGTACLPGFMGEHNYTVRSAFRVNKVTETFSLAGVTYNDLGSGRYEITGSGNATAGINYPATLISWNMVADARSGQSSCSRSLGETSTTISSRSINFNFNVTGGANRPPNTPNITGPTSARTTDNNQFVINATDPDGDTLRYGIDWNMDGIVNQWVPTPPSYVPSGTNQSAYRTWSAGSYTFQVLAGDNRGAISGWRTHTINITNTPPPPPPTCSSVNIERDSASACQAEGYDRELLPNYLPGSASSRSAYVNWTISGSENQCAHVSGTGMSKGLVSLWEGGGCGSLPPLIGSCTYDIQSLCINGKCKQAETVATSFGTGQPESIDVWGEFTINATVGGVTQTVSTRCDAGTGFGSCYNSDPHTVNGTTFDVGVSADWDFSGEMRGEGDVNNCTYVGSTAATADLTINGSDGPLDVGRTDTLNIVWSSTNAASCTLYGAGLPGGDVALNGNTSIPASAVTSSPESYVLSCSGTADSVQVNVVNKNPNPPTITYNSGTTETNQNITFNIQGTDPDNDQIYYEIDRDNNGTVDAATPGTGFVASNTIRPFTRSWTTTGSQTFQARTVDSANARSAWTQHTINISAGPPPPTAELDVQVNGGAWINNPTQVTIDVGDTVNIGWESTNSTGCSATAGTGFAASGTSGWDPVTPPGSGTNEDFTATCTGPGGSGSDTVRIITNLALPNLYPARATNNPGAIDPVTGNYQTIDLIFDIANNNSGVVTTDFGYRLDIDYGADGSFATNEAAGTITTNIAANDTNGARTTVTLTDFPFGNFVLRVLADTGNVVTETNEGDNSRDFNFTLAPADPGINLEADRIQVRAGDTVNLNWTRTLNYPMNCTVTGPTGVNVNPATFPGSVTTGPISSKSEFTLSCIEPTTSTTFTDRVIVETVGEVQEI